MQLPRIAQVKGLSPHVLGVIRRASPHPSAVAGVPSPLKLPLPFGAPRPAHDLRRSNPVMLPPIGQVGISSGSSMGQAFPLGVKVVLEPEGFRGRVGFAVALHFGSPFLGNSSRGCKYPFRSKSQWASSLVTYFET